jgi:hypothetical protein
LKHHIIDIAAPGDLGIDVDPLKLRKLDCAYSLETERLPPVLYCFDTHVNIKPVAKGGNNYARR